MATSADPGPPAWRRVWKGQFSSEAHLQRMLHVLNDFVHDPHDWIVMADNDEFQDWGGRPIR